MNKQRVQQQYSPPPTYSQSVQNSGTRRQLQFGRRRSSSSFDEPGYPPSSNQYTHSDGAQVHGWQSKRPGAGLVSQSVYTKPPVYKFSLHGRHEGAGYGTGSRGRPAPGMITRAETVGAGLGEGFRDREPEPEPENSRLPECGVCYEEFSDEGPHIPLNLNCGHSYCTGRYPCHPLLAQRL